jgi:hypothetical protein
MAILIFPPNPTNGQVFNATNGVTYTYASTPGVWTASGTASTTSYVEKTSDTGAAVMPKGTTGERPGSPQQGYSRFNTNSNKMEYWNGTTWVNFSGGVGNNVIYLLTAGGFDGVRTFAHPTIDPANSWGITSGRGDAGLGAFGNCTYSAWNADSFDIYSGSGAGQFSGAGCFIMY